MFRPGPDFLLFHHRNADFLRTDFITFQNKRAGSFLQAAAFEIRDDPWLPACFPLLWENLTARHWPRASWQTEPGSLNTFPSETALFCQLTDLWENRVCSGSSLVHISWFRILFRTFSNGSSTQQTCSCFHVLRLCMVIFLRKHPAHVTWSSALPRRTSAVLKKHMCTGLTFVTEFGLFFLGLLVLADGLLFCLKWDRPRCFPPSTFCTAGSLIDTQLHLFPPGFIYFSPTLIILPSFLLFFASHRNLPDGASHCSRTGLTGDDKPGCSSHRPLCHKSNNVCCCQSPLVATVLL